MRKSRKAHEEGGRVSFRTSSCSAIMQNWISISIRLFSRSKIGFTIVAAKVFMKLVIMF